MSNQSLNNLDNIQEPILTATPEVKAIIQRVLKLEKDKVYLKTPRNITDDIIQIVKDVIQ
jgi:hypothetical protein